MMISAIVPAKNEAGRAMLLLQNLALLPLDHIILVLNGCRDLTVYETTQLRIKNLQILYFHESLGVDVPRAIGAKFALALGSDIVLFVDGDMVGTFNKNLVELTQAVSEQRLDLALSNCYPKPIRHIGRCNPTFQWRLRLNQVLQLEEKIYIATPSHGPHAVSKKFLETIPLHTLAVPPVSLALAQKHQLSVGIGTTIPHYLLGSAVKDSHHSQQIIDTIVGDCLEGIAVHQGKARDRVWQNKTYTGYHRNRRFDILDEFMTQI